MRDDLQQFLRPGRCVDSGHPAVVAFAREHATGADDRERAVALFGAVRDGFRYHPHDIDLRPAGFPASGLLERGAGYCVPKAALLAASARVVGIPSRMGFADVRNHLTSERLRASMGTDEPVFHGFCELHLEGRWVKATPAFNRTLLEKLGKAVTDFDGRTDHAIDLEVLRERGSCADVPVEEIVATFAEVYPGLGTTAAAPGAAARSSPRPSRRSARRRRGASGPPRGTAASSATGSRSGGCARA
jgi:transglutaminase-like putative cysteine protease